MNRLLAPIYPIAFAAGLAAIAWTGAAALRHHPLAFAMTLLIAAFYLLGAWELRQFRQTTRALSEALKALPSPLIDVDRWLAALPTPLGNALRQRLEGSRVGLLGLALAPPLAGLLVLLGMLGTFLGLVVTLGGTAAALRATADLEALRVALTSPVQGLGLAFGTSVAGVASSAMLGLMVALARRERAALSPALDTALATALRPFTAAHRQEAAALAAQQALQAQAQALPNLVAQVQALAHQLAEQQAQFQASFQSQWLSAQSRFHADTKAAYTELAGSVALTLRTTLVDSAREAGAAIQPAVQATMASVAQAADTMHRQLTASVEHQVQAMGARIGTTATRLEASWDQSAARHTAATEALAEHLKAQLAETAQAVGAGARAVHDQLTQDAALQLQAVGDCFVQETERLGQRWQSALAEQGREAMAQSLAAQQALQNTAESTRLALADTVAQTRSALQTAAEHGQLSLADWVAHTQAQQAAWADGFSQQSTQLVQAIAEAQASQQQAWTTGDAERLAAWREALVSTADTLQQNWAQTSSRNLAEQQQLSEAMANTARDVVTQAQAQSQATISEVSALLQAAAEAPRAAAEVVAALREQLSKSLAQDNAALAERAELMQTLHTLLEASRHAATEQRSAIDDLVAATSQQLATLSQGFTQQVEHTSATLTQASTQLAASAAEMGSLGEGFGAAVAQFHGSSQHLGQHLAELESAMGRSMARSDEQLAYTVAQARELIDLCVMSQKQVIEELRQLGVAHANPSTEATHG